MFEAVLACKIVRAYIARPIEVVAVGCRTCHPSLSISSFPTKVRELSKDGSVIYHNVFVSLLLRNMRSSRPTLAPTMHPFDVAQNVTAPNMLVSIPLPSLNAQL